MKALAETGSRSAREARVLSWHRLRAASPAWVPTLTPRGLSLAVSACSTAVPQLDRHTDPCCLAACWSRAGSCLTFSHSCALTYELRKQSLLFPVTATFEQATLGKAASASHGGEGVLKAVRMPLAPSCFLPLGPWDGGGDKPQPPGSGPGWPVLSFPEGQGLRQTLASRLLSL